MLWPNCWVTDCSQQASASLLQAESVSAEKCRRVHVGNTVSKFRNPRFTKAYSNFPHVKSQMSVVSHSLSGAFRCSSFNPRAVTSPTPRSRGAVELFRSFVAKGREAQNWRKNDLRLINSFVVPWSLGDGEWLDGWISRFLTTK